MVGSKLKLKPQGALDGVDGEMASELLGRLDEGTRSKKRLIVIPLGLLQFLYITINKLAIPDSFLL